MAITPRSIDAGVGIGEIFVDKYRVDKILGHGGMGVVALCTHLALNEKVAIKMLRRDVLDDADAVERFMREAQAAVKLKSEYVARVSDVGRSRNNVPYMVMEYLEGHDLGDLLEERGTLGLPWAIELTVQACEALAEAHSLSIVHRDVKPTNLFVTWRPDGSSLIKVLDFGISKALTGNAMALTQTQSLLGTPAYMSPEQMRSARMVDARTDIWSLGTVLFEMLEGRRPFEAESFSEMCVKVAVDPPGAMTNTPAALQQVVLRCLEKAPEQRYASMAELARDLVQFSHDPHQAQVLVERMARTLRRSQVQQVEWNPSSSGISGPVRQLRSAERAAERVTPPAAPAEPADAAISGGVRAGAGPATPVSPEAAAAPLALRRTGSGRAFSETLAVTRPRSHRTLMIATVLIAAAAIGVTLSLARSPAPAAPAPPAAMSQPPPAVQPSTPRPAPPPPPPATPAVVAHPVEPAGEIARGSAAEAAALPEAAHPPVKRPPPRAPERARGAGAPPTRPPPNDKDCWQEGAHAGACPGSAAQRK
ncbi:MAG TPA: serine/threonine-protein kinase, partial [Kofleriaceae bacterium]|nr:serine/threonine-protein kinase [Kofleriaceae bacterium]